MLPASSPMSSFPLPSAVDWRWHLSLIEDLFGNGVHKGVAPLNDDQAEKAYPLLYELLNQREYKDGTPRCPPTVVIRRIPGAVEIVLQDHDFQVSKQASC